CQWEPKIESCPHPDSGRPRDCAARFARAAGSTTRMGGGGRGGYRPRRDRKGEADHAERRHPRRGHARAERARSHAPAPKDAAATLNISIKTAETHRTNIMNKLDLRSVTELVRYAVRNNIVEPCMGIAPTYGIYGLITIHNCVTISLDGYHAIHL